MRHPALLAAHVLVLLLTAIPAAAMQPRRGPEPLLNVGGRAATSATITLGPDAPELDELESVMTRRLRGVVAQLSARDLARFRGAIPGNAPRTATTENTTPLYTLTLSAPGAPDSKRVQILRAPDGTLIAAAEGADGSPGSDQPSILLDSDRTLSIVREWQGYRGSFDDRPDPADTGIVQELAPPYEPGAFVLDTPTLRERVFGRGSRVEPTARILSNEQLFIRLPKGYSPWRPAGLLVFVDPSPSGRPPPPLHLAADELGFIIAGAASSGNERPVTERMQLALDAAATVTARYHVDPERIYATGMSGGGRVSSMLWAAFPEVFRGAVAIVGVNTYQNMPAGVGRAWRAGFIRPTGERWAMLRDRRLAAITGSRDGNQAQTLAAIALMKADGLSVREYDYPDLAHEYPSGERYLEALRWVDEPARERREKESAAASELLASFKAADSGRLDSRARRRALVEVTAAGPWSDAAWEAAELLGLVGESGSDR